MKLFVRDFSESPANDRSILVMSKLHDLVPNPLPHHLIARTRHRIDPRDQPCLFLRTPNSQRSSCTHLYLVRMQITLAPSWQCPGILHRVTIQNPGKMYLASPSKL